MPKKTRKTKKKSTKKRRRLTTADREELFCQYYILDFNSTQAYIQAGYSKGGACTGASRMLSRVNVQNRIKKLLQERKERIHIDEQQILNELRLLAFSDVANITDQVKYEDGKIVIGKEVDSRVIKQITVKHDKQGRPQITIYIHDKTKNLELLMRHFSMLNDKLKVGLDKSFTDWIKKQSEEGKKDE